MFWVLKSSFGHPKHMFKLIGKEINAILGSQTSLIWTYVDALRRLLMYWVDCKGTERRGGALSEVLMRHFIKVCTVN